MLSYDERVRYITINIPLRILLVIPPPLTTLVKLPTSITSELAQSTLKGSINFWVSINVFLLINVCFYLNDKYAVYVMSSAVLRFLVIKHSTVECSEAKGLL